MTPPSQPGRGALTALAQDRHEFDLHGLVGVRLVDATPADVARVRRQLGPIDGRLDREPDITIRFVDEITTRPLTHVGLHETAWNEDGFFVLGGSGHRPGRALIPFERIGRHPEIVCERSLSAVPHLLAVVNQTALAKGVLPLHASAFTSDGTGILVTGWSKGGKTEALLSNVLRGADYVGDEWVYLTSSGEMFGIPEPIRLWSWQLDQFADLRRRRRPAERFRLTGCSRAATLLDRLAEAGWPGSGLAAKTAPVVGRQAYVQVPPVTLFGSAAIALHGRLDALVLVESHTAASTEVTSIASGDIAARMSASLREERARFMAHYRHRLFVSPGATSSVLEAADLHEDRLIRELLADIPATRVIHPYPCDISALGTTVRAAALDAIEASRRDPARARAADVRELRP